MRIAFAGAHRTGKTTLIEAVAAQLPRYEVIEEPYRVLEDEGYEFADPPTSEDFEAQLRRSFELIAEAPANALIDRSPLDLVAYLQALDDELELDDWMDDLRTAMAAIDLVVVVPIEAPDRIAVPSHEDARLRQRVDARIQSLVLDDALGLGATCIEATGTLGERVQQVLRAIEAG